MKLLWLSVNGEYAFQLSQDLIKEGYSATEIASTGDFLNYGSTIILLCIESEKVQTLISFIKNKMNEYRNLTSEDIHGMHTSDFSLFSIPLAAYKKIKGQSK